MTQWVAEPMTAEQSRIRLSLMCHTLPEVTSKGDRQLTFQVRGKTFAYFLDDHHGDGRVGLACKVPSGENEALIASDPDRFYLPAYVGPRGWVGLRLDRTDVDWEEVSGLLLNSYRMAAPKGLIVEAQRRLGARG